MLWPCLTSHVAARSPRKLYGRNLSLVFFPRATTRVALLAGATATVVVRFFLSLVFCQRMTFRHTADKVHFMRVDIPTCDPTSRQKNLLAYDTSTQRAAMPWPVGSLLGTEYYYQLTDPRQKSCKKKGSMLQQYPACFWTQSHAGNSNLLLCPPSPSSTRASRALTSR